MYMGHTPVSEGKIKPPTVVDLPYSKKYYNIFC